MRIVASRTAAQLVDRQKSQAEFARLRLHSRFGPREHCRGAEPRCMLCCRTRTMSSAFQTPLGGRSIIKAKRQFED